MSTSNTLAQNIKKNMKRINITLFTLMLLGILFSCTKASINYTQNGNWVGRATFPGQVSGFGVAFTINDIAYVGTGINPQFPNQRLKTFFKYNPTPIPNPLPSPTFYDSTLGTWSKSADFPGAARSEAVGFTIGSYGYVGSGVGNDGFTPLADFWAYSPFTNAWFQIDSIHDQSGVVQPRLDAVAWGFDTVGYVLTGTDNYTYFVDVWKYSPATNKWSSKPYLPGNPRSGATTWVYNGKGYIMGGFTASGQHEVNNMAYDFWVFDPKKAETDSTHCWSQLRDISNTNSGTYDDGYTNIVRKYGVGFIIPAGPWNQQDKGYITLGQNGTSVTYTWEYDFATDLWTEKTPFEGAARSGAVGFSLLGRGFVGTGVSQGNSGAFQDLREFFPQQIYNQFD
jgi:N-acetylneuraminic acid mutarotase